MTCTSVLHFTLQLSVWQVAEPGRRALQLCLLASNELSAAAAGTLQAGSCSVPLLMCCRYQRNGYSFSYVSELPDFSSPSLTVRVCEVRPSATLLCSVEQPLCRSRRCILASCRNAVPSWLRGELSVLRCCILGSLRPQP